MSWKIEWSQNALRELSKCEYKDAENIIKKLEKAATDPYHHFERLKGYDYCKLRVGDFRVIVLLIITSKTIVVQNVGHRKNIYKQIR